MDQQCLGITRSGTRCKISRNLTEGYCHLHRKKVTDAASGSAMPAATEPKPVNPQPIPEVPASTAFSPGWNTPLIVAAAVCILLLIFAGKKKLALLGNWR